MRYLLPGAVVLVLGITAWTRVEDRADSVQAASIAPLESQTRLDEDGSETRYSDPMVNREAPQPVLLGTSISATATEDKTVTNSAPAGGFGVRALSVRLYRELVLSPEQAGRVEALLREREDEVQACHQAMREASSISVSDYEWKIAEMKDRWFRGIDGLLDADQHPRFVALAAGGLFNEGLAFTIEPGMVILD